MSDQKTLTHELRGLVPQNLMDYILQLYIRQSSIHIESRIVPQAADRSGYVPWNVGVLEGGIDLVKQWIGPAFNIALWIFLILSGIFIERKSPFA